MSPQLLLVRHGQSAFNAGLTADLNSDFTPLGALQSREVGERLRGMDLRGFVPLVSPYLRARRTAEIISGVAGLTFEVDEDVREWGAKAVVDGREYPLEAVEDCVRRLRDFLERRRGQKLLVVSHAAPIALLWELARGEAPTVKGNFWEGVDNGCLIEVTRGGV